MTDTCVLRESHDAVVLLTISNPGQRNALTDAVLADLVRQLEDADRDGDIRAIVIAGSESVFASGADLRALQDRSATELYDGERARLWEAIRRIRTPVVAAVSGFCLGGGLELAMISDVIVASDTSRFGLPETMLGLIPGAGGTQLLPRTVGKSLAMDMILTGRMLDAHEAAAIGLVARVVGADEWRATALAVAHEIAARPAVAQRLAKESVNAAFQTGLSAGIDGERRAFAMAFASDDAREGMAAFLTKRSPSWTHR